MPMVPINNRIDNNRRMMAFIPVFAGVPSRENSAWRVKFGTLLV